MRLSEFVQTLRVASADDLIVFKAVFIAGGKGSGRLVTSQTFSETGLRVLSSDPVFQFLSRRKTLKLKVDPNHPESYITQLQDRANRKHMLEVQSVSWANHMLGLVLDSSTQDFDTIKEAREGLTALGYDTAMVFVDTTADVAKAQRGEDSLAAWKETHTLLKRYNTLFKHDFFKVANSRLLDTKENERLGIAIRNTVLEWISRPLLNPIGKVILHNVRVIGGRTIADLNRAL
jgi:hypothetical protein